MCVCVDMLLLLATLQCTVTVHCGVHIVLCSCGLFVHTDCVVTS